MPAAPPTSPMTLTGIQQPRALKGIVNTNDDPNLCATCSVSFLETSTRDRNESSVKYCCGKEVCNSCIVSHRAQRHCLECRLPDSRSLKESAARLKKHAKKGRAWAQLNLCVLGGAKISRTEMIHLYREAAKRGHPMAVCALGRTFLVGFGCPVDLIQAQEHLERGIALAKNCAYSMSVVKVCQEHLIKVARQYSDEKSFEKAKSILLPLAEEGMGNARLEMGNAILEDCEKGLSPRERQNDYSLALMWYSSAAFAVEGDEAASGSAEYNAMICCMNLGSFAQAKFWGHLAKPSLAYEEMEGEVRARRVMRLVGLQRELRALRDVCKGCGAEFEGKERNFCRGCRTYCYCSRECQKMHWNRKEGGHREDCKGMLELKQKMKERKRAEAVQK